MKSYNLALISDQERRDIELQRMAALLMHNFKRGSITRLKVETEIFKLEESEREKFKGFLNSFRKNKSKDEVKSKAKVKSKTNTNDGTEKAREWLNNTGQ